MRFYFGLPFADTETLNLNPLLENETQTKYAERLQKALEALKRGVKDDGRTG
jgi:hypothetical protein